jgi:phosphatidylserine synthase
MSLARPEVAPSGAAEEWIDQRLHRPLAAVLVRGLLATPLTPNQVTAIAGVVGVTAGLLMIAGAGRPMLRLAAALLLFTAVVLDCADGQLARARGTTSKTGDMLDGLADLAVNATVLTGMTYTLVRQTGALMWALGAVAAVSYGLQCSLFDFTKRTYLSRVGSRPLPSPAELSQIEADGTRAGRAGEHREVFLLWFYRQYIGTLASVTPAFAGIGAGALTARRMRAWTWLGLGTHLAALYVALALSTVWPSALAAAFVLVTTAGNLLLFALLR